MRFGCTRVLLIVLVCACGGDDDPGNPDAPPATPDAPGEDGPPLTIRTVDEHGDPVAAARVVVQPAPADPFWLEATAATCAGGGAPPCDHWVIEAPITARIAVAAERVTEAEPTKACQPYASTFALVHPGTAAQTLHLTLPTDGTYCIDPKTLRATVNVEHDEAIGPDDVLAAPPTATGPITVHLTDLDDAPVPGAIVNWYYPPKSPEFDGEHPLTCIDVRCETWVVTETPRAGTIYLNASYAGPLNPFFQQGWSGYDGAPFELEDDGAGGVVPFETTFALDTELEGAIGG